MTHKPIVPRELANRDVDEAISWYPNEGAEQAALDFIAALEKAYSHIGPPSREPFQSLCPRSKPAPLM